MAESWWIWVVAGLILGICELLVPGYMFLGLMIGAVTTGGLVWLGLTGASLPFALVLFGAISLFAWGGMRRFLGWRAGSVKVFHEDINKN